MCWTQLEKFYIVKGFPFCPENDIANAYIHHWWDRIAWCVEAIFQREISTPGVFPSYLVITPFFCNQKTDIVLHVMNHLNIFHIFKRFPLFQEIAKREHTFTIDETITWKSNSWVISLYHRITPRKVCGSHFITWDKISRSYVITLCITPLL